MSYTDDYEEKDKELSEFALGETLDDEDDDEPVIPPEVEEEKEYE